MTELLFRDDPYLLEFDARVVARREHRGQPAVVLDRTAFYPESGGQPWDTGSLGGVAVRAVLQHAAEILHVLEGPLGEEHVHGRVDAQRRLDHRQQHHGQHLLSRAFVEIAQADTVSFHLGADACSIDLERPVDETQVRAAEQRANEVVWQARPVAARVVTRREAEALGVRPPPEAGDTVRLIEAQGFDLQACGGTHPRSTAEVGVVLVLGHERYKGGSRVRFACGHRALEGVRLRAGIVDRLGVLLSAPLEGLPAATQRLQEQLGDVLRAQRELWERVLVAEARRLLAEGAPSAVRAVYEGWPPEQLRALAQRLVEQAPCVALLASRADKAHLVFAQAEGLRHDIPGLLREAAESLGGRGGGSQRLAQGGGPRLERLEQALARAAQRVAAERAGAS